MSAIFPKEGRRLVINKLLNNGGTTKVKLFKNNIVPDADTVLGDLTEADFDGYAELNPTGTAATINGSNQGEVEYDALTFTRASTGAAQTIYGYYLKAVDDFANPYLLLVELFPAPVVVTNLGEAVVFNLRLFDQPAP